MTLYGDPTVPTNQLKSYAGKRPGFQQATVAFTRHDCKARHLGDGGRGYNEEEARRPWRPVDGGKVAYCFGPFTAGLAPKVGCCSSCGLLFFTR